MGTIKRGSAGLYSRWGWERHTSDWQVIPTRRRLFQTTRLPATRLPTVLIWLLAIAIVIGVGRVLLQRLW